MTNLETADLSRTDSTGADVHGTLFLDNDLSSAIGLETMLHGGPSRVGIETIYKSRGKISEVFLRGAGVPDDFISFVKALADRTVEFYSCFISYSTKDREFAERLYADLQVNNVRCWFAPHDMAGGRKIHEQIDEAIRLHDRLLLILSPTSIESEWVGTEIANARHLEVQEGKKILFPVRLMDYDALRSWKRFDADIGKDSAREIREYFIPDFSDWKNHDSYQQAFQRAAAGLEGRGKGLICRSAFGDAPACGTEVRFFGPVLFAKLEVTRRPRPVAADPRSSRAFTGSCCARLRCPRFAGCSQRPTKPTSEHPQSFGFVQGSLWGTRQRLQTSKEYPMRQRPASFNLGDLMASFP